VLALVEDHGRSVGCGPYYDFLAGFSLQREERTGEAEVTGTDELESPWMCEFAAGSFIHSFSLSLSEVCFQVYCLTWLCV
jgi:hypothetical protein